MKASWWTLGAIASMEKTSAALSKCVNHAPLNFGILYSFERCILRGRTLLVENNRRINQSYVGYSVQSMQDICNKIMYYIQKSQVDVNENY